MEYIVENVFDIYQYTCCNRASSNPEVGLRVINVPTPANRKLRDII